MARKTESAPPLDETSRRRLDIGITVIGLCAAAWSAPTLYGLARLIDFPKQLAWLLPAALDGYAATSIWFGKAVPAEHPASDSARRNSRLALALTVSCNGLYHLLTLGGVLIPAWARIALLVVVSSLAPFILDRLLHLRTLAHGTHRAVPEPGRTPSTGIATGSAVRRPARGSAAPEPAAPGIGAGTGIEGGIEGGTETGTGLVPIPPPSGTNGTRRPAPAAQTDSAPARNQHAATGTVVTGIAGRRSPSDWAKLALPLWHAYVTDHDGRLPTAAELAAALRAAHPTLPVPKNDRSERKIREATENLTTKSNGTSDAAAEDDEHERELEAG